MIRGKTAWDVIVVGLGAHGSAAAASLARRGVKVLGFDAHTPPHTVGSSHGETRIIREVYAEHPDYVPLIQQSYEIWQRLEEESEPLIKLMHRTGGISIGRPQARSIIGIQRSAEVHRLKLEMLEPDDIRKRWPQLNPRDEMIGAYDDRAGVLFPESCVRAQLGDAARQGAELRYGEPVTRWHPDGDGVRVHTAAGEFGAGKIVFAAGAWNRDFVSKLNLPLRIERQVLFWFEPSSSPERFLPDSFPNASWEWSPGKALYCQADFGRGVKTAFHHDGEMLQDIESLDREVRPSDEQNLRDAIADIMPELGGNVRRSAVCMYTDTPDMHFLIDRHPGHPNVVISSACSGHGFKFSPAVGEIVADLTTDEAPPYDISLFGIDRLLNADSKVECPEDARR